MDDASTRREWMWARYGQPKATDAATALEALGITDVMPEQVTAFLYRDREAAEAYAAANIEYHGLSVLGSYELATGDVVGVLDLRPELTRLGRLGAEDR